MLRRFGARAARLAASHMEAVPEATSQAVTGAPRSSSGQAVHGTIHGAPMGAQAGDPTQPGVWHYIHITAQKAIEEEAARREAEAKVQQKAAEVAYAYQSRLWVALGFLAIGAAGTAAISMQLPASTNSGRQTLRADGVDENSRRASFRDRRPMIAAVAEQFGVPVEK